MEEENEYEKARRRRIAQNAEFMRGLQLTETAQELISTSASRASAGRDASGSRDSIEAMAGASERMKQWQSPSLESGSLLRQQQQQSGSLSVPSACASMPLRRSDRIRKSSASGKQGGREIKSKGKRSDDSPQKEVGGEGSVRANEDEEEEDEEEEDEEEEEEDEEELYGSRRRVSKRGGKEEDEEDEYVPDAMEAESDREDEEEEAIDEDGAMEEQGYEFEGEDGEEGYGDEFLQRKVQERMINASLLESSLAPSCYQSGMPSGVENEDDELQQAIALSLAMESERSDPPAFQEGATSIRQHHASPPSAPNCSASDPPVKLQPNRAQHHTPHQSAPNCSASDPPAKHDPDRGTQSGGKSSSQKRGKGQQKSNRPKKMKGVTHISDSEADSLYFLFDGTGKGSIQTDDVARVARAHGFDFEDSQLQDMVDLFLTPSGAMQCGGEGQLGMLDFRGILLSCGFLSGDN